MFIVKHQLQALCSQQFTFNGKPFFIEKGENLHTLSSYKYPVSVFQTIAKQGGFTLKESFVDDDEKMTIHVMQVA